MRLSPCVTETSRADVRNTLKKRRLNFMARFSQMDEQTALSAHIVNRQFLSPSNRHPHCKRATSLAAPLLAKLAAERSTMRL
jgi:hypothetical protein